MCLGIHLQALLRRRRRYKKVYKALIHECCSVCIRDQKEAFSVKPRFPDQFQYLVLDVEDNEEQNVIRLFPEYAHLWSPVSKS